VLCQRRCRQPIHSQDGAPLPTTLLTDAELAQLAGYPGEIASDDLATFFRLDGEDRR